MISIDVIHYNQLKNSGLIDFDQDTIIEIRSQATQKLTDINQPVTDENLKTWMKKFGVLEFFKQYGRQGKESVFYEPEFTTQ